MVTASWRQPRCTGGGAPSTWDITTPPTPFTAVEGRAPTVQTHTSRRPRSHRFNRLFPGDASFQAEVLCPGSTASRPGAIRIDVYYRLGTAKPTHASKHLSRTFSGGCFTPSGLGALTQITVTAPTRLRALVEICERGS